MFIKVAVPVPQLDLLTYRVPEGLPTPVVGARVEVSVGSRTMTGIVAAVSASSGDDLAAEKIKPLGRVLDLAPFIPADVVELAAWTADYYAAGVGETMMAALPPATRGGRVDAHKTRRAAAITPAGLEALTVATGKRRQALALLAASPERCMPAAVLAVDGISGAVLRRLAASGFVRLYADRVERDPFTTAAQTPPVPLADAGDETRELTMEQADALARIEKLRQVASFRVALLHGVTGSGKTEVYRRLIAATVADGGRALMLVPEIGLTPAVTSILRASFGDRVAVQHSALSAGERHDQWQRIRRGDVDIVIGTRSAIFAPLDRLKLIVVDEEHDASYKQEEAPRYNGRDLAVVRARSAGALVLLGSATPSLESYHNAAGGKYELVAMDRRVLDRPLASVTIVDMRTEFAAEGPDVVISRVLQEALAARLARKQQALVLLNRRGFATSIFCRQCGESVNCPNCSVSLVVHGGGASRRVQCHYCNYSRRAPAACPACAAPYLDHTGFGTERVEEEIRRLFPDARVARLDRDAVRRKGAIADLLERFRRGAIDLLVGTQMIAKGHDFPGVTLVGVVSADVGLGIADFRAAERTFQLLTQVAGRAGRGLEPGEAVVQTIYPEHYSIRLACRQDYRAFYEQELKFRRAMRYPPALAIVSVMVKARTLAAAIADATVIGQHVEAHAGGRLTILGPAPGALVRLRGEYRAQLLVKGHSRRLLRGAVRAAVADRPAIARRTVIDVDPLNLV